jgi:hypothetical protein
LLSDFKTNDTQILLAAMNPGRKIR